MKGVAGEDEKRLLWSLRHWRPHYYYSHKLHCVMFSIAEGQVEPRDRSERTNINNKSKETRMPVKWSVWAHYSVERASVLLQNCLHVVIWKCSFWVQVGLAWDVVLGAKSIRGSHNTLMTQTQSYRCSPTDPLLWGSWIPWPYLYEDSEGFHPVLNNLWFNLLEVSSNHVEICLHCGGVFSRGNSFHSIFVEARGCKDTVSSVHCVCNFQWSKLCF